MAPRISPKPVSWRRRIGWLVLIWGASVAALFVVAQVLRMLMRLAGMSL